MVKTGLLRMWTLVAAAILVAILLAAATFISNTSARAATNPLYGKTVVIDPGHGGSDPGARFDGSKYGLNYMLLEKDQNLDVSYRLKALLEASNATVYMTRPGDASLSNNDRYTYANTTGAKVLLSIHMNGSSNSATDYTTTLFGKWRKDKALANTVFNRLKTLPAATGTGTIATRTPYSFASGVLLKSNMPATIAETVFITSDKEGQLLSDGTYRRQQQIADALRMGIEDYLATR